VEKRRLARVPVIDLRQAKPSFIDTSGPHARPTFSS
jgi:hypothetical protein